MRPIAPNAAQLRQKNCSLVSGAAQALVTVCLIFRLQVGLVPAAAAQPLAALVAECPAEKRVFDRGQGKSPLPCPEHYGWKGPGGLESWA